jgi:hypothetical protein
MWQFRSVGWSNLLIASCLVASSALMGGCTADVTSGSFFHVKIGQAKAGVVAGLKSMGVDEVRVLPDTTATGVSLDELGESREVSLLKATGSDKALLGENGRWEFAYNDTLGNRAVRLEFDGIVLTRIHVRWYPSFSFLL